MAAIGRILGKSRQERGLVPLRSWRINPCRPATPEQVEKFIVEIDALLRRDHHENYCGIVYADNLDDPTFIKIYDPNHLGSSCGSSKNKALPGWIMSQTPPAELRLKHVVPANRKRWWQMLLS